jgi:hypothetical protein
MLPTSLVWVKLNGEMVVPPNPPLTASSVEDAIPSDPIAETEWAAFVLDVFVTPAVFLDPRH